MRVRLNGFDVRLKVEDEEEEEEEIDWSRWDELRRASGDMKCTKRKKTEEHAREQKI